MGYMLREVAMEIILVRHGESEANVLNVFSNTGFKHGLTVRGFEQVHELVQKLDHYASRIETIYMSPLKRAFETAEIISEELDVPFQVEEDLKEFSVGVLEGRSDEEGWAQFSELWAQWFRDEDYDARIDGGESLNEISARMQGLIRRLMSSHGNDSTVLLIGHGGTILAALPSIARNVDSEFLKKYRMGNTDFYVLQGQSLDDLRCVSFNEEKIESASSHDT